MSYRYLVAYSSMSRKNSSPSSCCFLWALRNVATLLSSWSLFSEEEVAASSCSWSILLESLSMFLSQDDNVGDMSGIRETGVACHSRVREHIGHFPTHLCGQNHEIGVRSTWRWNAEKRVPETFPHGSSNSRLDSILTTKHSIRLARRKWNRNSRR